LRQGDAIAILLFIRGILCWKLQLEDLN